MAEPVSVQPMSHADLDEVVAIERLSHPIPKGKASFESDLENPVARCFSLRVGDVLVGYLVVWSSDVVEVIDIAVHPDWRGRRLADRLMAAAHEVADEQRVLLEVRESNAAARQLYARHGYRQVGVRRAYYADNGEDAWVLARDLGPERAERRRRAGWVSGLYPILSDDVLPVADFAKAAECLRAVSVLQLRFKESSDALALRVAREVVEALQGWDGLLVINDRADLLRLLDAQGLSLGLHVGQTDLPLQVVRPLIGSEVVLGFSTHDPAQLAEALALPADIAPDYVAYGPVFATATKKNPDPVVGLAGLEAANRLVAGQKPLVAIGGLDPERAAQALTHADAVAVIGALTAGGLAELPRRFEAFLSTAARPAAGLRRSRPERASDTATSKGARP